MVFNKEVYVWLDDNLVNTNIKTSSLIIITLDENYLYSNLVKLLDSYIEITKQYDNAIIEEILKYTYHILNNMDIHIDNIRSIIDPNDIIANAYLPKYIELLSNLIKERVNNLIRLDNYNFIEDISSIDINTNNIWIEDTNYSSINKTSYIVFATNLRS